MNGNNHLPFVPASSGSGIHRLNELDQFRPGNDLIHCVQKSLAPRDARFLLEKHVKESGLFYHAPGTVTV
ncbi:hypothetical protein F6R98_11825 [Candidatus Methylospira mobilis]|uniref:Uncharacterized protein n=1 Tax=Candidatus Methylospira mobilis TaxID=1808979 RepID=A0A5Q0BHC0_9GAMM|nr:hypothetical protein F6R98_11825 [Candidatus Methylospira mobilis]